MNARSARRILCVLGSGILLGLSACSPSNNKADANTILVWHWMTDREEALVKLTDQYQQQTGVKIQLELYAPSDAYATKVRAAAQTNTLPDVFSVLGESRDLASFINSGHIADLAPAMNADRNAWRKQFFAKALANTAFQAGNQYKVTPGQYGVPIDVTNIQLIYNKALFEKAGLNPEKPPRDWTEFLTAIRALKAAGFAGLVSGWGETWLIQCFASNYAFNILGEEKVLDTYRGKVLYTDPEWIQVFSLFEELRKENALASGVVTMVNKTAEQIFATEKAAFALNGSWCVNVYKGMNPDLRYGAMMPPPASKRFPMRIWGGAGSSFMVNARSTKNEQAIAFLKWLSEPAQQAQLSTETLNLPSNRASLEKIPVVLAGFAAQMDNTTHPTQWPVAEIPTVNEAFEKGIQSILIGEKTPVQLAQELDHLKARYRAREKRQ